MSKKSWPIFCSTLLYKVGLDFLDRRSRPRENICLWLPSLKSIMLNTLHQYFKILIKINVCQNVLLNIVKVIIYKITPWHYKNYYTIINLQWGNKVLYSMFSVVFIQLLTKRGYMISIYLFLRTALEILRKVFQTTFYGWMILVIYDVL